MKATVWQNLVNVRLANIDAQTREGVNPGYETHPYVETRTVPGIGPGGWDRRKLAREQELDARVRTAEFVPHDYLNPGCGGFRVIRIEVR